MDGFGEQPVVKEIADDAERRGEKKIVPMEMPGLMPLLDEETVLNLRNFEAQHHRANLRQLFSARPRTPTSAQLNVSEGRKNPKPTTTNAGYCP